MADPETQLHEPQKSGSAGTPDKLVLCPYCGAAQRGGERCQTCGGLFEPLSQIATQIAMGPWYIRDKANPFRPGCSYEVLVQMIEAGRIKPTTVLRGPSTRQFWSVARNVEGISHLLGYCHSCHAKVEPTDASCESCGTAFKPVKARNELGLRFKTRSDAAKAQNELERQIDEAATGKPRRKPRRRVKSDELSGDAPIKPRSGLLEDVLEMDKRQPAHGGQDGETLDFAPSQDAESGSTAVSAFDTRGDVESAEPAAAGGGGQNVAIWVLTTLNIMTLGGLILLYVWTQGG